MKTEVRTRARAVRSLVSTCAAVLAFGIGAVALDLASPTGWGVLSVAAAAPGGKPGKPDSGGGGAPDFGDLITRGGTLAHDASARRQPREERAGAGPSDAVIASWPSSGVWITPIRWASTDSQKVTGKSRKSHCPSDSHDEHTTWLGTVRIFAAAQQPKGLWVVDGAAQVDLYSHDPAVCRARLLRFFSQHFRNAG